MIDTLTELTLTAAQAAGLVCACGDRMVDDIPAIPSRADGRRRGLCTCFRLRHREKPVAPLAAPGMDLGEGPR